jgi:hypothetical protein
MSRGDRIRTCDPLVPKLLHYSWTDWHRVAPGRILRAFPTRVRARCLMEWHETDRIPLNLGRRLGEFQPHSGLNVCSQSSNSQRCSASAERPCTGWSSAAICRIFGSAASSGSVPKTSRMRWRALVANLPGYYVPIGGGMSSTAIRRSSSAIRAGGSSLTSSQ